MKAQFGEANNAGLDYAQITSFLLPAFTILKAKRTRLKIVQEKKKMETNETPNLEIGIGTKEMVALKPSEVEIKEVNQEEVGEKKNIKIVCTVKHPDKPETIKISSLKYIKADKVIETGLWLNKDEDNLIRKGSALAVFMNKLNVSKLTELKGKKVQTDTDSKGYLTFKAF